jgi:DNA segregation ATPase FtsK/SpoIIIE-like protein
MRAYYTLISNIKEDPPARLMGRGVLDQLLAKLIKLDQERVAQQVVRAMEDQGLVGRTLSEVLFHPQVIACDTVLAPLSKLLLFLFQDGDLEFPGFPPGLFFFMFHENESIRQWASRHIEEAKPRAQTDATETEDDDSSQYYIPLSYMRFTIDYVANWLRQIVVKGLKNGPTLAPLTQLISVASDEFWLSLFRLFDNLSEKELDEIFPSVFMLDDSTESDKSNSHLLNDILSLLPQIRKPHLALQLMEVLLSRVDPPHTFWFKTKLMPISVLKLISKEFERAKTDEDHRRWYDLLEAVAVSVQYSYQRCDLLDPIMTEIFKFTVVQVQEAASVSDEAKLEAGYTFARAFEEWRKNPLSSYQRSRSDGPEPSIELRSKWATLLIRYVITQSPVITPDKRLFVGRVVASQLSNDATRISDAATTFLNSLNKLLVRPSVTRASSGPLTPLKSTPAETDPLDLRVLPLKDLWYNATACCGSLNEPVHAAILTAFRDLALLDLDYCGGLKLASAPPAWQATCEHLRNVLVQFKTFEKTYFGLANTSKTRCSSIFSFPEK